MIDDLDGVAATAEFSLLVSILEWSERLALWVRNRSHGTVTVGCMYVSNFIMREGYLEDLMYLIFNAGCSLRHTSHGGSGEVDL